MTADFGQLKQLEPGQQTIDFPLYSVKSSPTPVLKIRHAGRNNPPYASALDKQNAKTGAVRRLTQGKTDRATGDAARNEFRELFARFVVVGWENVRDAKGELVQYSVDNCRGFLFALPDYLFEELMRFAADQTNFLPDMPDEQEVEEQAKN